MMLNKNGWGLKEMIVVSGVLIFFLVLAIYNIYTINTYFKKQEYYNLENRLLEQSLVYLDNYYDDILTSEGIIVSNNLLKKYDLDIPLVDKTGSPCDGYVKITKSHGKVNKTAYITCNKYSTMGYEDWRI